MVIAGLSPNPCALRHASISARGTTICGAGHSLGSGAPAGKAGIAQRSMKRGSDFSPQRQSLSRPKRTSPTNPVRSGMPASAGAIAAFQVRGSTMALP